MRARRKVSTESETSLIALCGGTLAGCHGLQRGLGAGVRAPSPRYPGARFRSLAALAGASPRYPGARFRSLAALAGAGVRVPSPMYPGARFVHVGGADRCPTDTE